MAARKKKSVASGKTEIIVNAAGARRKAPARRRSSGGGRSRIRRAVRGYSRASRAKQRGMIAAAAAAMGYASQMTVEPGSGDTTNMYSKIPAFGGLPVEATIALGAHFLAKGKPGLADDVATAAAAITGYKIGKNGLKLEGLQVADLSGLGDLSGMEGMEGDYDDLGYVGDDGDDVGDDGYID